MKRPMIRILISLVLVSPALSLGHETDPVLGSVTFPTSCDAKVQADFQRAVAMLHSFWYSAGEDAFRDVLKKDPQCAIAGWGIAAINMSNPLNGQGASPKGAATAQAAIDAARATGAKTERERDYIDAVAAYYQDFGMRSERERQVSRAQAYQALAKKYPDDDEAQIFSALYTAGTQTASDQTYAAYLKAAATLEEQFKRHPDHPGVAHYLIHSYDAPPIADKGLVAAHRYAEIAPAAPHALHMPSHIFTRVGAWSDSAATNVRSFKAARDGNEPDEAYHASDYMVYAYLQLARDADARRAMDDASAIIIPNATRFVAPYAMNAMPARYALERGDWKAAANLPVPGTKFAFTEAITYYARALGAARMGDLEAARKDAAQLEAIHTQLLAAKNNYWATEVEVSRLAVAGWIALREDKRDEALKFMNAAADLEDRSEKNAVTPGRVVPARELLGDMYLELKQPKLALAAYEASQKREPNRFRNYYGTARAADMAGDRDAARTSYRKLLELARDADSSRPELVAARAYVVQ